MRIRGEGRVHFAAHCAPGDGNICDGRLIGSVLPPPFDGIGCGELIELHCLVLHDRPTFCPWPPRGYCLVNSGARTCCQP